jgi:hypothetical protein
MGDPVRVGILDVDTIRSQINLNLIESLGKSRPAVKKRRVRR